jgi:hypothetical protein
VTSRPSAECKQVARAGLACAVVFRTVGVGEVCELEVVIGSPLQSQAHVDVTSIVMQQYIARHCTCTRYKFRFVLFHRKDVQREYVANVIQRGI